MDNNSLVQNEGVNAGSAEQLEDSGVTGTTAVGRPEQNRVEPDHDPADRDGNAARAGGDPAAAPARASTDDLDPAADGDDAEMVGTPDVHDPFPGQSQGSAGQDSGSME